ncbi:MAG: glycosyltransferase [Lachnospiraceae bacterium]|nr:glycosyltransferase [Lachnospiraceae bacterium]
MAVREGIKPAIVVVAYRRLDTLDRLLKSIAAAKYRTEGIPLIISIDHHPDNSDVIALAEAFVWEHGEKTVKTHEKNLGLRTHILECGNYAEEYGSVILLEDDEFVAPYFYEYAKKAHEYYDGDERIAGISLYGHEWNPYAGKIFRPLRTGADVFFGQFSCTWGQSWSADQWKRFRKWYEENGEEIGRDELLPPPVYDWKNSWGKYFFRYLTESGRYYVIPQKPVVTVFGGAGTHYRKPEAEVQTTLWLGEPDHRLVPFEEGPHYDAFFENADLKGFLAKRFSIPEEEILIDLYGLKHRLIPEKYRYVISSRKLDSRIMAGYELNLRPQEANVLNDCKGDAIFLYDRSERIKNRRYRKDARLNYDFGGVFGFEALSYGYRHLWDALLRYAGLRK